MIPRRNARATVAAVADAMARRSVGGQGRRRGRSVVVCPIRQQKPSPPHLRSLRPPSEPLSRRSRQSRGRCDCGWRGEVRCPTGTPSSSSSSYVNSVGQRLGAIACQQQHHRTLHDLERTLRRHNSAFAAAGVTHIGPLPMAAQRLSWNFHHRVTDARGGGGRRCISSPTLVAAADEPITRSCLSTHHRDRGARGGGPGPDSDDVADGGPRRLTGARETGFHVAFLGTGGSVPSRSRNTSCTALRLGGHTLLFDAGEGLQRQLALSTLSVLEVRQIYLTHLHGDHLFGLPGLLLQIGVTRRVRDDARMAAAASAGKADVDGDDGGGEEDQEEETIELYGPPGLYNYVAMSMTLSCARFHRLRLVVHELSGGGEEAGPTATASAAARNRGGRGGESLARRRDVAMGKNPFLDEYPEFAASMPNVTRVRVPRNGDGTWTLRTPARPTREEIWDLYESKGQKQRARMERKSRQQRQHGGAPQLPKDRVPDSFLRRAQVHVTAAELRHQPGVQTFGYVVTEVQPTPPIDPDKAERLGVRPGPKYMLLKHGYPVDRDDKDGDDEVDNDHGSSNRKVVHPEQVLLPPKHVARKFALLGDHYAVPEPMARLCEGADVLVHEAAGTKREASEALRRGHATASMAGRMADEVNAKVLVLNHFRGGMQGRESIEETVREAEDAMKGDRGRSMSSRLVIAAYDFMELLVPRGGF